MRHEGRRQASVPDLLEHCMLAPIRDRVSEVGELLQASSSTIPYVLKAFILVSVGLLNKNH